MDPRHLVQLAVILEQGSLSQASHHLHLTQPTLTHNMQTLEMQAGGKLFERSRFGVRSTPLGDMLAREGRAIARRLKDAVEVTARHQGGMRGHLRLGTGPLIGAACVPNICQHVLSDYPNIHLLVQSDRPHVLVDQLVDGRHDMVIAPSWLDRPPSGVERFLFTPDDLGVFCGKRHPMAKQGVWDMAQSKPTRWLSLGTASPFDQHVREMLKEAGVLSPKIEVTILGDVFGMLRLLEQGRHLAVLPRYPLRALSHHFSLAELDMPSPTRSRDIYLWCRSNVLEDPTMVALKDLMLAQAAALPKSRQRALGKQHLATGAAQHGVQAVARVKAQGAARKP